MHYIWYILGPTLSFNSKRRQNFSVIFDFSLLEWRVAKNHAHGFWLRLYFLRFWPILHFCFLWNRYLKLNVHHNIRTAHFLRIAGTVLLSGYFAKYTPLLKDLRQRFFELELEYCTLTENPLRRLIFLHWYCNFNPHTRLNNVWYLWNAWYFS